MNRELIEIHAVHEKQNKPMVSVILENYENILGYYRSFNQYIQSNIGCFVYFV